MQTIQRESLTASLVTQGDHKFFTLTVPMEILSKSCFVIAREDDNTFGFQRLLDEKRAQEIADYIDNERGVIPTSIILSAQPSAELIYDSKSKTIAFNIAQTSFLIIDGQHRVYGFKLSKSDLRVPVVIFSGLSKTEEARLFIDINTKQRPVPNELLLDIKNLARYENENEEYLRTLYDTFYTDSFSILRGFLSPARKEKNKLSRVTFNSALKTILAQIINNQPEAVYPILNKYLIAFVKILPNSVDPKVQLTNATLFSSIILLFPKISVKVKDKFQSDYTVDNFYHVLEPIKRTVKTTVFLKPGGSYRKLHDIFVSALDNIDLTF
jgi:DGQHR domain-containing protein